MAAPRYSRIDAPDSVPEVTEVPADHFNRISTFSNTLPDLALLNITASPDNDVLGRAESGESLLRSPSRRQDSTLSPEVIPPAYFDFADSSVPARNRSRRQNTNNSWKSRASNLSGKVKDFGVSTFTVPRVASPWDHETPNTGTPPDYHTVKEFDHKLQRRRLFTNSAFQWFVTVGLCGCLAGILYSYSLQEGLYSYQKHAFNALVTGFSIGLGMNLASSLRGYAQMMRWRFLASAYRHVQEFELVMQCESQMKVLRLFWTARTQGRWLVPNKTQVLCFTWIFINVLLQVLVAMLGLTYSMDNSNNWILTQNGNVSIVQLGAIYDPYNDTVSTYYDQLNAANTYGVSGTDYGIEVDVPDDSSDQTDLNTIYTNDAYDYMEYRFDDDNPYELDQSADINIVTDRTINATAVCESFKVIGNGGQLNETNDIITFVDKDGNQYTKWVSPTSPGAVTYMGNTKSNCGPRCTEVWALQVADGYYVLDSTFFKCNNTVGWVMYDDTDETYAPTDPPFQMPDEQAKIIAGAIGWSGFWYTDGDPFEYVRYSEASWWSPAWQLPLTGQYGIAALVMEFSMYAVAAMDDHGPRKNVTSWDQPNMAQVVDVTWEWAVIILAVIPAIQLIALVAIIAWANKAIIKDNSFLGAARLLRPLVDHLGPHGCMLTGDQIAEELKNVRIAYGYRSPPGFVEGSDMVRHVGILKEHEGLGLSRAMPPGRYDGEWVDEGIKKRRRTRRMSI